jgi:exopolyphosphatase/guanosine-5'-triphosphate,3'-diphosphate pyrophosphatase
MAMRVGVLDVGSNTIRLLVADVSGGSVVPVEKGRVRLALGEEIELHGSLSATSIRAAAKAVKKFREAAAEQGVEEVDVFLTAPGRQAANAAELVAALRGARVLTKEEEGTLAYRGAVATCDVALPARIAVVDVGGASTEIAVGAPGADPDWIRSVDLGSVRLTTRAASLDDAQREAGLAFADIEPPAVQAALVVGGTARAARRLVGPWLGPAELAEALHLADSLDVRDLARRFDIHRSRGHVLLGGIAILVEVQRRLGVPLHVCDGGIREGAALSARRAIAA